MKDRKQVNYPWRDYLNELIEKREYNNANSQQAQQSLGQAGINGTGQAGYYHQPVILGLEHGVTFSNENIKEQGMASAGLNQTSSDIYKGLYKNPYSGYLDSYFEERTESFGAWEKRMELRAKTAKKKGNKAPDWL